MTGVKPGSKRVPAGTTIPAAFAAACAVWLAIAAWPRSVEPHEAPPFYESPREAEEQETLDLEARRKLPRTTTAVAADDAFRRFGVASLAPGGERPAAEARQELSTLLAQLRRESGTTAVRALRAEHAWAWVETLSRSTAASRATRAELGGDLSLTMQRAGLLDPGAVAGAFLMRAHPSVLAVFAKARWNVTAGLERTSDFDAFDLRVFHGYRATRLREVRIATRIEALEQLVPFAGDYPVREALGTLRYQVGDYDRAMAEYLAAMEGGMRFRLRNHLRAAAERAGVTP